METGDLCGYYQVSSRWRSGGSRWEHWGHCNRFVFLPERWLYTYHKLKCPLTPARQHKSVWEKSNVCQSIFQFTSLMGIQESSFIMTKMSMAAWWMTVTHVGLQGRCPWWDLEKLGLCTGHLTLSCRVWWPREKVGSVSGWAYDKYSGLSGKTQIYDSAPQVPLCCLFKRDQIGISPF